jgi:hypothetical protein
MNAASQIGDHRLAGQIPGSSRHGRADTGEFETWQADLWEVRMIWPVSRTRVSTLDHSSVRVSELCALKIGKMRLHDPERAHFVVTDAKDRNGHP